MMHFKHTSRFPEEGKCFMHPTCRTVTYTVTGRRTEPSEMSLVDKTGYYFPDIMVFSPLGPMRTKRQQTHLSVLCDWEWMNV